MAKEEDNESTLKIKVIGRFLRGGKKLEESEWPERKTILKMITGITVVQRKPKIKPHMTKKIRKRKKRFAKGH